MSAFASRFELGGVNQSDRCIIHKIYKSALVRQDLYRVSQ